VSRAATKRPAPAPLQLPEAPPELHIREPARTVAAVFNPAATPCYRYVGDRRHPDQTARFLLRSTWVSDSRQTLIHAGKKFRRFDETVRDWVVVEDEAIEASIYHALVGGCWSATPEHVDKVLRTLRLALHWPPPAWRFSAAQP